MVAAVNRLAADVFNVVMDMARSCFTHRCTQHRLFLCSLCPYRSISVHCLAVQGLDH